MSFVTYIQQTTHVICKLNLIKVISTIIYFTCWYFTRRILLKNFKGEIYDYVQNFEL